MSDVVRLTDCQTKALAEIMGAIKSGVKSHVLTGYAGTGKTTLMEALAGQLVSAKMSPVMTAPTHKAVSVLSQKLRNSGVDVPTMTIHSLLGLAPKSDGRGGTTLKRSTKSCRFQFRTVIIDECSMIGSDLMGYITNDLANHFVLFVGDPAQLPPVNESESRAFSIRSKSNLDVIVRQAIGNPILEAATIIRSSQDTSADWSWCAQAENGEQGVFLAGNDADAWMEDAFTSSEFAADNDFCRYLCWTNEKVTSVNARVRKWIYGETATPFVLGERVLCRTPIMIPGTNQPAFSTNEEAVVHDIAAENKTFNFSEIAAQNGKAALQSWSATVPMWRVDLACHPAPVPCWIPQDQRQLSTITGRLVAEAKLNHARWYEHYTFKDEVTDLRSVYAMTVHTSQGSTFDFAFVDLTDIRKREYSNPREMQQLLYVAATRPRKALVLIGA